MSHEMSAPALSATAVPAALLPAAERAPRSVAATVLRGAGLALFVVLIFSPGILLAGDRYWLPLFHRYVAVALFAISVDLVWGYAGLLTLGHGLYFGIGAYLVGYSLMFQTEALKYGRPLEFLPDMYKQDLLSSLPNWAGFLINIWYAFGLAILIPAIAAFVFGWVAFKRRIKGVYFSLLTQALMLSMFFLVLQELPYDGGPVGMLGLRRLELFGHVFTDVHQYYLNAAIVVVCFLGCLALMSSRFGKIMTAIRDSEFRLMALGFDTASYKTFLFTLSGALAGLSGALFVCSNRNVGPDVTFNVEASIKVVIFVAVGGRGTLFGAIVGAILVQFAETYANDTFKGWWPFIMGSIFVGVVVFLPEGIVGLLHKISNRFFRGSRKRLSADKQV